MFKYDFMVNAFLAGSIIAILSGIVGYFLVLRSQTFASHALAHVGFTGATGAVLIGLPPLLGMIVFTLVAAIGMAILSERIVSRDVAVGIILSLASGTGLLFSHLSNTSTIQITSLLFGNILSINHKMLITLVIITVISLLWMSILGRRLIFTSLQPELAEARGISLRVTSILFLAVVAISVAMSIQIVGIILVFTLLVTPAAAAQNLSVNLSKSIFLAVLLALTETWCSIILSYYTDWPINFWIACVSSCIYLLSTKYNIK